MAFGRPGGGGAGFGKQGAAHLGGANSKGIRLSASSFQAASAQGTAIGTLSVVGGLGTYTFTLTDSHTNAAQVAGTNGVNLQVGSASSSASTFNVTVHADNGAGSTFDKTFSLTAWSSVSNSVAPAISGSAVQGATLSVTNGTWAGFPAPSYSYQWKRAGSAITAATGSTYVVQNADVGSTITCTVTASNGFSSASATSSATATVTKTTLSYSPVTSATQNSAYTGATPSTSGGTASYTYSVSGTLPTGLSLNTSTGVISGTPTAVQTASGLSLVVTDANGVTDSSSSFSIAVSAAGSFLASAQKIMAINASPRTITSSALSIDISNTGNSTINGRALASGGIVATSSIPDGYSGPLNANSKWIITKPPATQTSANLTYAPGNSKLFLFSGQKFDFKGSVTAGVSFTIRWSTDNGLTWNQSPQTVLTQVCWCLIDFGTALGANGVVEVIGDDELFETFGFNFDTGSSAPGAFTDTALPIGMVFGDSFVFGAGSRTDGVANDQRGSIAMVRKTAETIGSLQAYNHGFRTNGFSNDHSGVQSKFKDRILDPVDGTLSEGNHWGAVDYFVICSSINDDTSAGVTLQADATAAFQNIRTLQPNALIVFAMGARGPDLTEGAQWVADYTNAFKAVFGTTQSQQTANGAYLLDGSRTTGAAWIPAGAIGSSAYFEPSSNVNADTIHPNAAGHAFFGQKYAQGVIALATLITAPISFRVTTAGDSRVTTTGDTRRVA